jgi:hypothetical protein
MPSEGLRVSLVYSFSSILGLLCIPGKLPDSRSPHTSSLWASEWQPVHTRATGLNLAPWFAGGTRDAKPDCRPDPSVRKPRFDTREGETGDTTRTSARLRYPPRTSWLVPKCCMSLRQIGKERLILSTTWWLLGAVIGLSDQPPLRKESFTHVRRAIRPQRLILVTSWCAWLRSWSIVPWWDVPEV